MRCDPIFNGTGVVEVIFWTTDRQPAGGDCISRSRDDNFYPYAIIGGIIRDGVESVIVGNASGVIICDDDLAGVAGLIANVYTFPCGHG